jgi:hypothetical protein
MTKTEFEKEKKIYEEKIYFAKNPSRKWENETADIISKVMRISKKEAEIEVKLALSEARIEYPEKLQNRF